MASRSRLFPWAFLALAAAVIVVWWVARTPDPGSVDRLRAAPDDLGVGPLGAVPGPVATLTSVGSPGGGPEGEVTAGSLWVDSDGETLTATSLVDDHPVWTYSREDQDIDDWTVSGDAVWVLFGDHLLVRLNVGAAKVAGSTVVDQVYDGDDAPDLTGDASGGVVLQGTSDADKPVWWVRRDLDPVALRLPAQCDGQDDAASDGDRIYLIARCGDERRVMAFGSDGSRDWVDDPGAARRVRVDRGQVVAFGEVGGALLDADSGRVRARIPGLPGLSYVAASGGLAVAWEGDAPPTRSSLAVWSVDRRRFVWRLPGIAGDGSVSVPLLSDGHLYYTEVSDSEDGPGFRLVVVDVATGGEWTTDLQDPGSASCSDGSAELRPWIYSGIPGGIVVSWQDSGDCASPVLQVYAAAD